MIFLDKPILDDLIIGDYRKSQMKVVSGIHDKERVHFEVRVLCFRLFESSNHWCIHTAIFGTPLIKSGATHAALSAQLGYWNAWVCLTKYLHDLWIWFTCCLHLNFLIFFIIRKFYFHWVLVFVGLQPQISQQ